jgi:undecaprenyl-diphosphatase
MELIFKAIVLGIVEGITEFLPISSTGHLIIVNQFLNFTGDFANMFDIVIQLGAILAVVVYFWDRLFPFSPQKNALEQKEILSTWFKVIVGVIPALILGGLFGDKIDEYLFNPGTVAIALLIGGILLIIIESRKSRDLYLKTTDLTYLIALGIGLFQCLSMIPGTSRAAATIIGAMLLGASRVAAIEFSFFLAIPTMFAASGYSILKQNAAITQSQWLVLGVGFLVSFLVAWGVIALFMNYIRKHNFKVFGYYRIVLAIVIGLLMYTDVFVRIK